MNSMIKFLVPMLLSFLGKAVPDGYKVYAIALVGIAVSLVLMFAGDYSNGGMMLWASLLAFAGRHTAEKLTQTINEATNGSNTNG